MFGEKLCKVCAGSCISVSNCSAIVFRLLKPQQRLRRLKF